MAGSVQAARGVRRVQTTVGPSLQKTLAPFVFLVALLLIAPGLWAVAILGGMDVPMAKRSGAGNMAILMLVSWPVAILLGIGSVMMWRSGPKKWRV